MISGHSHSFDVGIAKTLGINAAIVFNHIVYWLRINAAKGNNIHENKVWMYETQQEIADFLEYMTLEQVKKAIVCLLDAGVLIKGNFNSNPFDKTAWYTTADQSICKIKKTLTKAPYGAIDKAHTLLPSSDTAPCIYKVQEEHIQEEQQQQKEESAAAFSKSFEENGKPRISPKLHGVNIPVTDKFEIASKYDEKTIDDAIDWATHPETKLNKGLAPAIKWACQNKPEVPKNKVDQEEQNKAYAKKYDGMKNGGYTINVLSKCIEIDYGTAYKQPFTLEYTAKGFKEQLDNALRKACFPLISNALGDFK
jgi:hypothetical protein